MWSDGTCDFCRQGLQTSCRHGGQWGHDLDGGQGEAVRVPQANGTLVKVDAREDSALLPSLLTLSDVFCTGHHAAVTAGVTPRTTVAVVGDGAVGLSAVLAAKRLGAERIILLGRHQARTDLGREFGATDVVAERGEEGVAAVRELTGGDGAHAVLECVGTRQAIETALAVVRDGGTIGRVGASQYTEVPMDFGTLMRNITLTGGVAPARAYIPELLPDVLDGTDRPGQGLRPHRHPRRGPRRLPRHGRPAGPQGPDRPVTTAPGDPRGRRDRVSSLTSHAQKEPSWTSAPSEPAAWRSQPSASAAWA